MKTSTKIAKAFEIIKAAGIVHDIEAKISCQVYEYKDRVNASYDYTFRRDTASGAFAETRKSWPAINARLEKVANDAFIKRHFDVSLRTLTQNPAAKADPGDEEYSEYEQSIGANVRLTLKPAK